MTENGNGTQPALATFGAGCFWGVEAAFRQLPGVLATAVGYSGGSSDEPSYEAVCSGASGHAEVVQVTYDPTRVEFRQLLDIFWSNHDATQLNRQGPDVGTQYRSVIFTHDDDQAVLADADRRRMVEGGRPVVTSIEPAPHFWMAEDYHQQYLEKRGQATCRIG